MFRFLTAIALVVAVALGGVALEKRTLQLRRGVTTQHYREGVLREQHARLRLRTQELGAPARLVEALEEGRVVLERSGTADESDGDPSAPLLFWDNAPHSSDGQ